ncbi:hypothetical protein N0V90_001268 [Kalmusia sp. IMI 367209]|nr:hypothetical protein N0V90_001268 [Kalmusia sp. IMI 367209]
MSSKLRIAMFNTDTPVPTVRPKWNTYGKMFEDLLIAAASRIAPHITIESTEYDIQKFEYPPSLTDVDVILVTGSAASSYETDKWIRHLDDYVQDVYKNHHHVKILLREYGARVEKDPKGYELGVKEIRLEEKFRKTLRNLSPSSRGLPESLRVQMIHADHVVVPTLEVLPDTWTILGSTQHCAIQGMYDPARVLTLQGHFEFDRFVNTEIMKVFGVSWDPQMLQDGLEAIDADDDAELVAEVVLQFLLEKECAQSTTTHQKVGGLLTPPLG